ncbi:MAG TPA: TIGR01777 family oxidoreductase [Bacteroidota bacterium]|nr:TIGR01777 family oxidoreductase [Bacteroidota bacterium]
MKIVIAGGTGFIGTALVHHLLDQHHSVAVLTRNPKHSWNPLPHLSTVQWDGRTPGAWSSALEGADAVVNLSGESIASGRWTAARKQLLIDSRVESTRAIVEAMRAATKRPEVLINSSAVGYYGDVPWDDVNESFPQGNDFLANLCQRWEAEARRAEEFGIRVVLPRTGIVLDKNGGALKKMLLPFRFFAGGPLGSGKQWMPWITLQDHIRAMLFVIENKSVSGPVNFTAPNPVTMKEFASAIGKAIHRPAFTPAPAFALKLALGEMSCMILTGQRAVPEKLLKAGFMFEDSIVEAALRNIIS